MSRPDELLELMRAKREVMVADLAKLVECESPSSDFEALRHCADVLAALGTDLLGQPPTREESDGAPVLRFGPAPAAIVMLGHLDTVHPVGTAQRIPFGCLEGRLVGPGVFDMKSGLVQGLYALSVLPPDTSVCLLVTSDEELGSPDSRPIIEAVCRDARAVLVLEPSSKGRLKTARKGVSNYRLAFAGRAAHAGLEPERGANACLALAAAALAVAELAAPDLGTSVTPTVASAGTSSNTVPDAASLTVDVRAYSLDEQQRVDVGMRRLTSSVPGVGIEVHGGINRPPLPAAATARLYQLAVKAAVQIGLGGLEEEHVGGGSDGNFTAALGIDTLDGLGAAGDGAHTEREWVAIDSLPERASLLVRLVELICADSGGLTKGGVYKGVGTEVER